MDKERKVYNIFYNEPQGTRVRGRPENRWMDCVLSDIKNAKLGTGRSSQGIEGYGGGLLRTPRPALGCSANEEEEEICRKETPGRSMCKWQDNIIMDLKEIGINTRN